MVISHGVACPEVHVKLMVVRESITLCSILPINKFRTVTMPVEPSKGIQATQATVPTPTQGAQGGQLNSTQAGSGKVCLRIVPVKVQCQNSSEKLLTYALLDNGSDVSLCTKGLAARLGVQGEQKTFYLTTQEKEDSPKSGQEISLTVEALDGSDKLEIQRLWTVDKVNASSHSIPTNQDISSWPHLQDINLLSIEETNIELIRIQCPRGLLGIGRKAWQQR
ncbi:hypothetical protein ACROYT_G025519 [Oculina patagonica]